MSPKVLIETLFSTITSGVNAYIWGAPGIGKSDCVKAVAKRLGLPIIDIRAVQLDPVDLRGLPVPNHEKKNVNWYAPGFLPHDPEWKGIIFWDEIAQAAALTQSSILQLLNDHRMGEYVLPPGAIQIAASNRQEDRAGAMRVISPVLNRFMHFDLDVSTDDWLEWALTAGIPAEIRGFIGRFPQHLFRFKPEENPRAFPTPRSWSFAGKVLRSTPDHLLHGVISGCVGEGAATEFKAWLDVHERIPNIEEIMNNPTGAKLATEPAVLYALTSALAEVVFQNRSEPKKCVPILVYATRIETEFSVRLLKDAVTACGDLISLPEAREWFEKHGKWFEKHGKYLKK